MTKEYVEAIFIRQVTAGDFWNVERSPHTDVGRNGSSQTYFDVPLGSITAERMALFGGEKIISGQPWPLLSMPVAVLGDPTVTARLEFGSRGSSNNRYKINNQARRRGSNSRHPAWTPAYGFPEIPDALAPLINSKEDDRVPDVSNVKLLVIKCFTGNYYATFVNTHVMPAAWPAGVGFEKVFQSGLGADMIDFARPATPLSLEGQNVLDTWRNGKKNVLLYGPSGTGKTHLMQELWQFFAQDSTGKVLTVDPSQPVLTAFSAEDQETFEAPIRCEWITFHQNYSYEQFILALRPEPAPAGGVVLKPRAGVLLDVAMDLNEGKYKTAILFIDEINRGNVSRIFGEFITFMDDDYRIHKDGNKAGALPVPLGTVRYQGDKTEPIERLHGGNATLSLPWHFPHNFYIVASMNSVDRAVAPLDTALARRFARIEIPPSMDALAQELGIKENSPFFRSVNDEDQDAGEVEADTEVEKTPEQTAATRDPASISYLLLYRLNYILASTLGTDFEIGHTYLYPVARAGGEDEKWLALARVWDQALYPQLRERYNSRPEVLASILRTNAGGVFQERKRPDIQIPDNAGGRRIVDMPSLEALFTTGKQGEVKKALIRLAGL